MAALAKTLRDLPAVVNELALTMGLVLIGYSVLTFRGDMPFPSYWAAFPVAGACLIIAAGSSGQSGYITRLLSVGPVVLIGAVSYGWYLWHWPLLTFGRIYSFMEPSLARDLSLSLVAFGLSLLMYWIVEKPLGRARRVGSIRLNWRPVGAGVLGSAFIAGLGLLLPTVIGATASGAGGSSRERPVTVATCRKDIDACLGGKETAVFVIGDSQVGAALPGFADFYSGRKIVGANTAACLPFYGIQTPTRPAANREFCNQAKADVLQTVRDGLPTRGAILLARWNIYTPWKIELGGSERVPFTSDDVPSADATPQEHFVTAARNSVQRLHDAGIERILVVLPNPEFRMRAPECVVRSIAYGLDVDRKCAVPRSIVDNRRAMARQWLVEAMNGLSFVRVIEPIGIFCDEELCRPNDTDGVPLFQDDDHLSFAGTRYLASRFRPDFEWVGGIESH